MGGKGREGRGESEEEEGEGRGGKGKGGEVGKGRDDLHPTLFLGPESESWVSLFNSRINEEIW